MICLSVLIVSCAKDSNNWESVKIPDSEIPHIESLPDFPKPINSTETTATYTKDSVVDMVEYTISAKANTKAGQALTEEVKDLRRAAQSLADAGQTQENITNMLNVMLQDERIHNVYMSIGYWVIIIALVAL